MLRGIFQSLMFVLMLNFATARKHRERRGHSTEDSHETSEEIMNPGKWLYHCACPEHKDHLPIIIGCVLGAVIVALLVVIIILIVLLKRRSSVLVPVPPVVSNVMYVEPERKPMMAVDNPPMYTDVIKTAPE
ncbi:unnamed protein product [Lymnaea stagnalis]|uniref:Uncharacterized protein n=1 Tax=Lymnaea stagnalis TaxID=6523 RepID=A0AAV2H5W7_LYMST